MRERNTVLARSVDVAQTLQSKALASRKKRLRHWIRGSLAADHQRSFAAMERSVSVAANEPLTFAKQRQHAVIAPAGVTGLLPLVVVSAVTRGDFRLGREIPVVFSVK